jgi:HPt (histidine-containing phosphotransfer) domain-containing protein
MNLSSETKLVESSPFIDEKVLDEFKKFMGEEGEALVKELIELYLKNTPKLMANIQNDIKAEDMESLKAHVHGLKGSSAQLGVIGISSLCKKIEEVTLEGKFDEIKPLHDQLIEVYRQVAANYQERISAH